MIEKIKTYDELTFTDNFMFVKILSSRKDLCKEMLELFLGVKIKDISIPDYEKMLDVRYDSKSIRLDLYAEDNEHSVYDVEMQVQSESALPERSRYYHSVMDIEQLHKGEGYENLKNTYVIFILKNGLGKDYDLPVYTYMYQCQEDPGKYLNDRTWTILINANCTDTGLAEEMKSFLHYIRDGQIAGTDNGLVSRIDNALREAKEHRKWRMEYMTFEEELRRQNNIWRQQGLEEGRAEGREEGRAEERKNTEFERARADAAEKELEKYRELFGALPTS